MQFGGAGGVGGTVGGIGGVPGAGGVAATGCEAGNGGTVGAGSGGMASGAGAGGSGGIGGSGGAGGSILDCRENGHCEGSSVCIRGECRQSDIVESLRADGRYGTPLVALDAADLTAALRRSNQLTVFAPTDDTFQAIGQWSTRYNSRPLKRPGHLA